MDLSKIRFEYNKLMEQNKKILKLQARLSKLESKRIVKEYIELKKKLENKMYLSNDSIIEKLFDYNVVEQMDCNIYVYDGECKENIDFGLEMNYFSYRNLADDSMYKNVSFYEVEDFKKRCVVIHFKKSHDCNKQYYALRKMYLEKLLKGYEESEIISSIIDYGMLFGVENIEVPGCGQVLKKSK